MALQDELKALKARTEVAVPSETLAIMHRATSDLAKSGLMGKVPRVGDMAPDFALSNTEGVIINSRSLLERGPLVLTFYRGGW